MQYGKSPLSLQSICDSCVVQFSFKHVLDCYFESVVCCRQWGVFDCKCNDIQFVILVLCFAHN